VSAAFAREPPAREPFGEPFGAWQSAAISLQWIDHQAGHRVDPISGSGKAASCIPRHTALSNAGGDAARDERERR